MFAAKRQGAVKCRRHIDGFLLHPASPHSGQSMAGTMKYTHQTGCMPLDGAGQAAHEFPHLPHAIRTLQTRASSSPCKHCADQQALKINVKRTLRMKGWARSSRAEGRQNGSFCRHRVRKSSSSGSQPCVPSGSGTSSSTTCRSNLYRCCWSNLLCIAEAGSPAA